MESRHAFLSAHWDHELPLCLSLIPAFNPLLGERAGVRGNPISSYTRSRLPPKQSAMASANRRGAPIQGACVPLYPLPREREHPPLPRTFMESLHAILACIGTMNYNLRKSLEINKTSFQFMESRLSLHTSSG